MFLSGKETRYDSNTCGTDILSKEMMFFLLLLKSGLEQERSNKNFPFYRISCKVLNEVCFGFVSGMMEGFWGKIFFKCIYFVKKQI